MLIQGQHGAPAPARLVTLQGARLKRMTLVLWCERCRRRARKACVDLPEVRRNVSIGELWLTGRFRCGACGKPPLSLSVVTEGALRVTVEQWSVGEPFVAERLRRHWRHDPYDRRDWAAWYGRTDPHVRP
ncbi:hypothetical protein [Brevundimonas sp. NIBR11]|uniref:hypothetical protein n=1 Tax=Brevundimonas sp. NIBR11 TaxID=3015999 RepID=UPI0022EFFCB0|nr:hypothetical protein [Brevundimonas sp. NIBR11]WGM30007.1 hypothetical protein KKHFBJBL_00222 [Brevundimonas sp. NIBR11]